MAGKWKAALIAAVALTGAAAPPAEEARFDWIEYREPAPGAQPRAGEFRNPVLPGFYPDPSLVRAGNDFYLVNSTFAWFPGIPVWHSRDLVHWRQIGNAIDRPGQLDFKRLNMSRGVFAPAISHDGTRFYIVNTCVDCGGNYVITADRAEGPWSDPVWLPGVGGIDPSIFFDDDGSAWIVNNDAPPGGSKWDGHRAIWLHRFDARTLRTVGAPKLLVDAGVDPAAKPIWIEGPHLFKREGRYYLTAAEGGTSIDHSQVIFRADRLDAPFVAAPAPINPILTQRDLDPARPAPITSAGHADLVEMPDGRWWAVFLATRPYDGDRYNTGRETFLLPVTWRDGWPTILPRGRAIPRIAPAPVPTQPSDLPPPGASPALREEFDRPHLGHEWLWMRSGGGPRYRIERGALTLAPGEPIGSHGLPAFVARRQRQAAGNVTTTLRFVPGEGAAAGLAAVQDDDWFVTLALTRREGREWVELRERAGPREPEAGRRVAARAIGVAGRPLRLALSFAGGRYTARYAIEGGGWVTLGDADGTILSTQRAGGFTGAMIGPFASR